MKRYIIYVLALVGVLLIPVERTDVGKLRPVQTVAISKNEIGYIMQTDTGDLGFGEDISKALADLMETTPAVIYLDTAEFLLVTDETIDIIEELRDDLRDTVEIYRFKGKPDLEKVSKYLSVHGDGPQLKSWAADKSLSLLDCQSERIRLT